MSPKRMTSKLKKHVKNAKSKCLKPTTLSQPRYTRATARYCTDIGKKRVVLEKAKASMELLPEAGVIDNMPINSPIRPTNEAKLGPPITPKSLEDFVPHSESILESLPMELLVKIMCHLHHDQLRAVFHVSQRIRRAVIQARRSYFDYTTPDRSRQEMLQMTTPQLKEHWPFMSKRDGKLIRCSIPHTPNAPRHGPRPPRLHLIDMNQVAAVLFQESAMPLRCNLTPSLTRPFFKSVNSNRVLFYEEELCQAVSKNKLR